MLTTLQKRKKLIALNAIITLVMLVLQALIIFIIFSSITTGITFERAFFLTIVGQLSTIISITPSGIGIREPIFIFVANSFIGNCDISIAGLVLLHAFEWGLVIFISILLTVKKLIFPNSKIIA